MGGSAAQAWLNAATLALLVLTGTLSHGHEASVWIPREDNASWRTECGSCHVPYPPQLLAASDWLLILSQLENHFGTDASLDPTRRDEITNFLDRNGVGRSNAGEGAGLPRITHTDHFIERHQGAIRLWRKGRVKSLSDCLVCHAGAAPSS